MEGFSRKGAKTLSSRRLRMIRIQRVHSKKMGMALSSIGSMTPNRFLSHGEFHKATLGTNGQVINKKICDNLEHPLNPCAND